MSKRTRVAVVAAALLLGVVGPVVAAGGNRQAAQASTGDVREVIRVLDEIVPRAGWMRTGRPAIFTGEQRWKLLQVACTVNDVHGYVHEASIDEQLWQLDRQVPGAYRLQSSVLALSERIAMFKERAGTSFEVGTARFCIRVGDRLKQLG